MGNIYGKNPITLDTFTSAIDIGSTLFGKSNAGFKVLHIEWEEPASVDDTATITDGGGNVIFNETGTTAKQSLLKSFGGAWISGIKIAISGVSSGKISILLA